MAVSDSTTYSLLLVFFLSSFYCTALVPKPTEHDVNHGVYYLLDTPLEFVHDYPSCDVLQSALNRFVRRLGNIGRDLEHDEDQIQHLSTLSKVFIQIQTDCDDEPWPSESMVEACKSKTSGIPLDENSATTMQPN